MLVRYKVTRIKMPHLSVEAVLVLMGSYEDDTPCWVFEHVSPPLFAFTGKTLRDFETLMALYPSFKYKMVDLTEPSEKFPIY